MILSLNIFRTCDRKYDVILMDRASEITELDTLAALAFSPSSIILFGDGKRYPADQYNILSNDEKYLKKYFYQTIFHYLMRFGRNRVINI